jgi:dTDP-glucose 4,6-dehydratase
VRAVLTGAGGFLGSHLTARLLDEDWHVTCVDSFVTGLRTNLSEHMDRDGFEFVEQDVSEGLEIGGDVDWVLHFASLASPRQYLNNPFATLKVGSLGTLNCLGLALEKGAGFMLASTSEVYGDPQVHPQPEDYWGNVNPIGPRAVYDESKRFSEAASASFARSQSLKVKIVRIFNTYGPGMRKDDGRAVPNFIQQALANEPLTVHGDGSQTRSLCYVDDLIEGIVRWLYSEHTGVVNIGNPDEAKILELVRTICDLAGSASEIKFVDRPIDDPEVRCPDITRARQLLNWEPTISLTEGLNRTIDWAKREWA